MTMMDPPCSSSSGKRKRPACELGDELSSARERNFVLTQEVPYVVDDDEDEEEEELVELQIKKEYQQVLKAQEPSTVEQYDDIKVTPFNLDDEREEGEFDDAGNFTFKRESKKDEMYDTWAESIDWKAIEENQRTRPKDSEPVESANRSTLAPPPTIDRLNCFKQMLRIIRPGETVQRAIKRLGDQLPKRRLNRAKHKLEQPELNVSDVSDVKDLKSKLDKMIELAHQRLEDGEIDIYQKSYEDLEEAINS